MQSRTDKSVQATAAPAASANTANASDDDVPSDTWGNRHGLKVMAAIMIGAFILVVIAQLVD